MEGADALLIGLAPLVEHITGALKAVPFLAPFAPLVSLLLGYAAAYLLTQNLTDTLLLGSAIGGTASVWHKGMKYVDEVQLGEPEVSVMEMEV